MARRISSRDPNFSDRIRELLYDEEDDIDDPSSEEIDDSDADPDFELPAEEGNERDSSNSDEDEDNLLLEEAEHAVVEGEDFEHAFVEDEESEHDVVEGETQDNTPEYFVERMKKSEKGCPNAWSRESPPNRVRTPARNIVRTGLPGVRGTARLLGNNPSITDVWKLFFDDEIMTSIVENTNVKLRSVRSHLGEGTNKNNYRDTCIEEVNALLGLFVLSSVLKSNDEKIHSLFTKDSFSRPIFPSTMSEKRYEILSCCLRFDNRDTRDQRKENDKAAPISEIFNKFILNSQAVYCISSETTVDEMLIPFRGRCSFKVYMPQKPKKYGIKVMCLADAKSSYLYNAYIYTGKGSDGVTLSEQERKLSIPTQSVVRVCKPIEGSNRNITADNWFTSIETPDELLKRKLTYVGTVKKDKKLIPVEFLPKPERPIGSSLYGFRGPITLLSFVPKKNRAVCLISTMHHNVENNTEKNKPEMIHYYNKTKCGVDLLDMKCAVFTSSRKTRRWPLAVFYRMLNIACVNSFIVYMSFTGTLMMKRFEYVKKLGHMLIVPHLRMRLANTPNLPRTLQSSIQNVLAEDEQKEQQRRQKPQEPMDQDEEPRATTSQERGQPEIPNDKMGKRKTCGTCPYALKRKTAYMCIACKKPICMECSRRLCTECAKYRSS